MTIHPSDPDVYPYDMNGIVMKPAKSATVEVPREQLQLAVDVFTTTGRGDWEVVHQWIAMLAAAQGEGKP